MNSFTRFFALIALTLLPACGAESATDIARNDDVFALASTNVVREQVTTQTIRSGGVVDSMASVEISRQLEPRFTTLDIYMTKHGEVSEMQIARNKDFFMSRTTDGEWVKQHAQDVRLPVAVTELLKARVKQADLADKFDYTQATAWNNRTLHEYTGSLEAAQALLPTVTANAHDAVVTLQLDDQGFVVQIEARIEYSDRTVIVQYDLVDIEDPILSMAS